MFYKLYIMYNKNIGYMSRKNTKTLFALAATFIFLSLTFLPTVQSEDISEKTEDLQEVTFEIHTLNGIKEITKLLSSAQIDKLKTLTEELSNNLQILQESNATITAQSEAGNKIDSILAEFKGYGLLGDYSINEAKNLITGKYIQQIKDSIQLKRLEKTIQLLNEKEWDISNTFCCFFAYGNVENYHPFKLFYLLPRPLLDFLPIPTTIGIWKIHKGPAFHGDAGITTKGLFGEETINIDIGNKATGITIGFFGIIIRIFYADQAIGFSLFVAMKEI